MAVVSYKNSASRRTCNHRSIRTETSTNSCVVEWLSRNVTGVLPLAYWELKCVIFKFFGGHEFCYKVTEGGGGLGDWENFVFLNKFLKKLGRFLFWVIFYFFWEKNRKLIISGHIFTVGQYWFLSQCTWSQILCPWCLKIFWKYYPKNKICPVTESPHWYQWISGQVRAVFQCQDGPFAYMLTRVQCIH